MCRLERAAARAGADRQTPPRPLVTAMTGLPGPVTVAPATGCPEAELVTFPVMGRCWASAAPMPTLKLSASVMNQVRLTTAPPYLVARVSLLLQPETGPQGLACARFRKCARGGKVRYAATCPFARSRPRSAAYTTGPAAASKPATSTPGRPISRLETSRPTAVTMSRIGSAARTASPGILSGTRNAPRSAGSARRSRNSAANSSASAAVYNSTSPAKRPPNGTSANPEYTKAETSTALRGGPRASVTASAAGNRPSCASTNGIREYASSSALKSANALTSPAPASQTPSHGPTTAVASLGHAPSVHVVQSVSASTGTIVRRYAAVTSGSVRASARGYVAEASSISPPIVDALSQPL